jgi:adenylate cyclase
MSKPFAVIKRHALRLLFSLTILLFFILHATETVEWSFINTLERHAYDIRLKRTMPNTVDNRIVIVAIDEKSLSELGRWPWNRSVMASLIDQLFNTYQIDVLGMDVMFTEPDNSSGLNKLQEMAQDQLKDAPVFLETLNSLEKTLDYDGLFANSMQNRRIVLGYAFTPAQKGRQVSEAGQLPPPTLTQEELQAYNLTLRKDKDIGFAANLPQFQANAMTAGHFVTESDPDSAVRRVPMLYGYKGQLYESLSLAVARVALGEPEIELGIVTTEGGYHSLEFLQIGLRKIPVDGKIQALVPFRGKSRSFPYLSASDVLYGRVKNPELLKDKSVLIGATAYGLDLHTTPVGEDYPDVEIHANLISGILDNNFMENPESLRGIEVLLLILIGLFMILILPLLNPLLATLGTVAVFGFVFWLNMMVWDQIQLVLPLATTFLLMLTLFLFNMSYGYFLESSHKHHLTNLFGQYVPPELVDEMSQNLGSEFSMEGENREMTVLFSDVRGFTSLSEGLSPKQLSELMNEYLTPMTHIIHEYRGTIDKYMGDAIMAFWGAPLHDPQHARHTLDAAMEMQKCLEEIRAQFKAKGWPEIRAGIGINTGVMSVGNMGSQFRMAYTVLGDAVNLGSRLEGVTKQYRVQIIVSETTKEAVPEYLYRELDRVRVKGKDQPVVIYEPIGLREEVDDHIVAEIAEYDKALQHYRQQCWDAAAKQFTQSCQTYPDCQLYKLYAERVRYFIENPPADNWDGVYTFTTK